MLKQKPQTFGWTSQKLITKIGLVHKVQHVDETVYVCLALMSLRKA